MILLPVWRKKTRRGVLVLFIGTNSIFLPPPPLLLRGLSAFIPRSPSYDTVVISTRAKKYPGGTAVAPRSIHENHTHNGIQTIAFDELNRPPTLDSNQ